MSYLETLSIRPIYFNNSAEKAFHDKLVSLIERMLEHEALITEKLGVDKLPDYTTLNI